MVAKKLRLALIFLSLFILNKTKAQTESSYLVNEPVDISPDLNCIFSMSTLQLFARKRN